MSQSGKYYLKLGTGYPCAGHCRVMLVLLWPEKLSESAIIDILGLTLPIGSWKQIIALKLKQSLPITGDRKPLRRTLQGEARSALNRESVEITNHGEFWPNTSDRFLENKRFYQLKAIFTYNWGQGTLVQDIAELRLTGFRLRSVWWNHQSWRVLDVHFQPALKNKKINEHLVRYLVLGTGNPWAGQRRVSVELLSEE